MHTDVSTHGREVGARWSFKVPSNKLFHDFMVFCTHGLGFLGELLMILVLGKASSLSEDLCFFSVLCTISKRVIAV